MTIRIVPAGALHCREMADLLNEIIRVGGTTALATEVDGEGIQSWMSRNPGRSAWHVAEDDSGRVLGFQWITVGDDLPPEAAEIATFARVGMTGLGIGSKLFEATKKAARSLGYTWINANIRADNTGGLSYYQSRGFEDYGRKTGVQLDNGLIVDKVLKRFDL